MTKWTDEEWRAFAGKVWAKHYPGSAFILEAADIVVLNAAVDEARGEASKIPPDMIECDKCGGTGTLLPPETLEAIDRIIEQTATEEPRDAER